MRDNNKDIYETVFILHCCGNSWDKVVQTANSDVVLNRMGLPILHIIITIPEIKKTLFFPYISASIFSSGSETIRGLSKVELKRLQTKINQNIYIYIFFNDCSIRCRKDGEQSFLNIIIQFVSYYYYYYVNYYKTGIRGVVL